MIAKREWTLEALAARLLAPPKPCSPLAKYIMAFGNGIVAVIFVFVRLPWPRPPRFCRTERKQP